MGQIASLACFEAKVMGVDLDGTVYAVSKTQGFAGEYKIPPLCGGSSGAGFFMGKGGAGCKEGDWVLLTRVPGGALGDTEIIRTLPSPSRFVGSMSSEAVQQLRGAGTRPYPVSNLRDGDIKIVGAGGGAIHITGPPGGLESEVFIGNDLSSGHFINNTGKHTYLTSVGHSVQSASSGHRFYSGDIIRIPVGESSEGQIEAGHDIPVYTAMAGKIKISLGLR